MSVSSPRLKFGLMNRLIRKELSTILRDRRTIITLVLMPLLLYPLLTIAFRQFFQSATRDQPTGKEYKLGFRSQDQADLFDLHFSRGQQLLVELRQIDPDDPVPRLSGVFTRNIPQALIDGEIQLGIEVRRVALAQPFQVESPHPEDSPEGANRSLQSQARLFRCDLIFLEDSAQCRAAKEYVERRLAIANNPWLANPFLAADTRTARLRHTLAVAGLAGSALAVTGGERPTVLEPRTVALVPPPPEKNVLPMNSLIPLILILMTMTGAVYPAIDLTAGERERGTLEVLIAAPIPRMRLLFAKYVAVVAVAVLTAVVNLSAMTVTIQLTGLGKLVFDEGLTTGAIIRVLLLMFLFAAFFSAVLLCVTSFARSFKEGQAYLIPLMLVSMTPGMASLLNVKLEGVTQVVPLLNIVLLTREMLLNKAVLGTTLVVVFSTAVYAIAAVALAARIFGAEAVLYSEQGNWGDLFRRPKQAQPSLTVTSALFCVAIMFPVSFVVLRLLAPLGSNRYALGLVLITVSNLLIYGSLPFLFAWLGRVRFREGFRLERASLWAWMGAVCLGLSLWALADQIHQLMRMLSQATPESIRLVAQTQKVLQVWREHSPFWIVATLAFVPAVLEELFFRGLMLGALLRVMRPGRAILTSAIFFGAFHLSEGMFFEKILTTTVLGIILGSLAWWTGSVIPGIITHALHNSFLLLLAYYQRDLVRAGWIGRGPVIPLYWSLIAAGLFLLGLLSLWLLGRSRLDVRKIPG